MIRFILGRIDLICYHVSLAPTISIQCGQELLKLLQSGSIKEDNICSD